MKLISRYILKAHIGPFLFGSFTVLFLFLFQFILRYIDQLIGKGLSEWVITQLIVLNIAWMVVLAVPMGVLFSTLMSFGAMSASNEVTIIKASGGSLLRMMFPVMVTGLLLSYALFRFNDDVLPEANHRAKVLLDDIRRKKPTFSIEAGQFSTQLEGYTILSRSVDSLKGTLKGVTIYDNSNGQHQNIVSADTGIIAFTPDYSKLVLNLYNGEVHQFMPFLVANYRVIGFHRYQILINAQGFTFEQSDTKGMSRGDREMRIRDMQKIVNEARAQAKKQDNTIQQEFNNHFNYLIGKRSATSPFTARATPPSDTSRRAGISDAQKRIAFLKSTVNSELFQKKDYELRAKQYDVEIQKKYAIPFACFIFVLVGCPLGIMTRGGNFGVSAAISLGFYIIYWGCLIGGEKLADRALMSPFLSMWLGNIIIGIMGIFLIYRVNTEAWTIPGFDRIKKLFKKKHEEQTVAEW